MPDQRQRSHRRSRALLLGVIVVLVNVPLVQSLWLDWRVERSGVEVTGTVTEQRVSDPDGDPRYWIAFRLPATVDPARDQWPAQVEEETYDRASTTGEVRVRVLPDRPSAHEVKGEVRRWAGLVTTLVVDGLLVLVLLILWRSGGRPDLVPVRMSAVADLEPSPPGAVLEEQDDASYIVRGEVVETDEHEVVLVVGDRVVVIVLDGHRNPVLPPESAQVRARRLD
ncbi:hypothetical protein ACFP3Q_17720 [Nocardioides sp. GCM10027113]|uniref:hypothetical protein n=1 Tax=unclassified Nocardioides TaxID=2615069 RepID=UPI003609F30D